MANHKMTITLDVVLSEEQYQRACAIVEQMKGLSLTSWDTPERLVEAMFTIGASPLIDQRLATWEAMTLAHITGQSAGEGGSQ